MARVAKCGRLAWSDQVEVRGVQGDDGLTAYPVGVVNCGSVWACAVCSAKIAARRSIEVELAASAHVAAGGGLLMATLTVRHGQGQSLVDLLDALKAAWRAVQGERWWRGLRCELVGMVTATEITRGPNGWHPHLHLLLFVSGNRAPAVVGELQAWLPSVWQARVATELSESAPDLVHGVHVQQLDASAAAYVAKIADETTRADLKADATSVWGLLDALDDGEAWAVAAWCEWFAGTKGRRAIVWSRGLKAHFGIGELSDEEIAAQEVGGLVLDVVPSSTWLAWCRSLNAAGVVQALAHLEALEAVGRTAAGTSGAASCPGGAAGARRPAEGGTSMHGGLGAGRAVKGAGGERSGPLTARASSTGTMDPKPGRASWQRSPVLSHPSGTVAAAPPGGAGARAESERRERCPGGVDPPGRMS